MVDSAKIADRKQWLQGQKLIPLLLSRLSTEYPSSTQTSAGDFLKAIITISANATAQDANVIGPNELTRQLVSEECIQTLIGEMLRGGNPLTVGVGIVIEVIRKNNSDYDVENAQGPVPKSSDPIYLGTLLRQFSLNVPKFMDLIQGKDPHSKNGANATKRELKVAFGAKIEPLGFDRFKTCELMAELLHCSNMALLNERGAEAAVKKRDEDRDALKAEGKLAAAKPEDESALNFGTSVDSHGFHHARAPSSGESPEEIKRPDLTSNAEEEFEKVNASDALGDEMKDEFDEKEAFVGEPLSREHSSAEATHPVTLGQPTSEASTEVEPTAENRAADQTSKLLTAVQQADSPTSAGLTERLGSVELDPDTVMQDVTSAEEQPKSEPSPAATPLDAKRSSGDYRDLSPHPEDKPAPLFARRTSPTKSTAEEQAEPRSEAPESAERSDAPSGGDVESESILLTGQDDDNSSAYTLDVDGSPVVGDLLKIMFVDHNVVPTILVRDQMLALWRHVP